MSRINISTLLSNLPEDGKQQKKDSKNCASRESEMKDLPFFRRDSATEHILPQAFDKFYNEMRSSTSSSKSNNNNDDDSDLKRSFYEDDEGDNKRKVNRRNAAAVMKSQVKTMKNSFTNAIQNIKDSVERELRNSATKSQQQQQQQDELEKLQRVKAVTDDTYEFYRLKEAIKQSGMMTHVGTRMVVNPMVKDRTLDMETYKASSTSVRSPSKSTSSSPSNRRNAFISPAA